MNTEMNLFGRMFCAVICNPANDYESNYNFNDCSSGCKSESAYNIDWNRPYSLLLSALMLRVSSPRQSRHVQLFSDKSHPKYTSTTVGSNCSFPLARSSCHSTPQGRQGRIPRPPAVMLHRSASSAKCTSLAGYPSLPAQIILSHNITSMNMVIMASSLTLTQFHPYYRNNSDRILSCMKTS